MIYCLIPVYNEELGIGCLLDDLYGYLQALVDDFKMVVVNDGSKDRSFEIIEAFPHKEHLVYLEHKTNLGVDSAFKTGFDYILSRAKPDDICITLEGDGTSDIRLIYPMIEKLRGSGTDVCLASCYAKKGAVVGDPPSRYIFSVGANILLKLLFDIKGVHTYTSFYRAFYVRVIHQLIDHYGNRFMDTPGFTCMADMLIKMRHLPITVVEIPLILKTTRETSQSKLKVGKTIVGYFVLFYRNLLHRFYYGKKLKKQKKG